jgi:hypothetical protein
MSSGKGRKNSGNLKKNLVENVEFFIIWRFPFPDGESAKGGLDTFPIYIVKRRCVPVLIQEWIMMFGFLDQSFVKARSHGCGGW